MVLIGRSDGIQFHYYFNDKSHSINSNLRNECEKEILLIFKEISATLGLELELETLPTEAGGFKETWIFLGKNAGQITLIISVATIIISRFPVENKELNKLQIENLKLDNELKRKELDKLKLDSLNSENQVSKETVVDSVELINKNYKVSWHKSNLYRKLNSYPKVNSVELLRLEQGKPVGSPRTILKNEFSKFILGTDELPKLQLENAKIDVISPAIKRGKFRWKGFYDNAIINFLMNDLTFNEKVLNGAIHFSNRYAIEVTMSQERKIDHEGNIVVTNTIVNKVIASVEGEERIDYL